MTKIADNPRERADFEMANVIKNQRLQKPSEISIPASGDIQIEMCLDNTFNIDTTMSQSHVMYRMVTPSRAQSDYGPKEWFSEPWSMSKFKVIDGSTCELLNSSGLGYKVVSHIPIEDNENGFLHYKTMISTLGGTQKVEYPPTSNYYELKIVYDKFI